MQKGLPKNTPEAVKYFEKACDQRNSIACLRLFKVYLDGKQGVERDTAKAFEYTKKACEMNDMLGCLNASIMLRKGDGVEKDPTLSEFFMTKANEIKDENASNKQHTNITFGELFKIQTYIHTYIFKNLFNQFEGEQHR
jgi:TPR repeat protein